MDWNILILLFILVMDMIVICWIGKHTVNTAEKVCVVFFLIAVSVYSGIGIAYPSCEDRYLIHYSLFFISLAIGLLVGFKSISVRRIKTVNIRTDNFLLRYASVGTMVYYVVFFVSLLYPENKILSTLNAPLFVRDSELSAVMLVYKNNLLLYVLQILQYICFPLVFIQIYKSKSKWTVIGLLVVNLFFVLCDNKGYIARSGLISHFFIIIIAIVTKSYQNKLKKRKSTFADHFKLLWKRYRLLFMLLAIIFVVSIPILNEFRYFRAENASDQNWLNNMQELVLLETSYPRHYPYTEQFSPYFSPALYLIWLITLPLPKFGSFLLDATISINSLYSSLFMESKYSTIYSTIFLPSLLGEGILLYGSYFYWLHSLLLGFVIAFFMRLLSSSTIRYYWALYIAVNVILMARGGSQGGIGVMINHSILILALMLYFAIITKRKPSRR